MDFLNKAGQQIGDLFRSLTPGARITAALLLGVIVVSLLYLFQFQTSSADEYLLGGREFSSAEIAAAEAAFAKENLGKSEVIGNKIKIPRGQKAAYLAALGTNNALPKDFGMALAAAQASENPFASGKSLEMRQEVAKQQDLSLIISKFDGIEVATVTYDKSDKPGFPRRTEKRAMVAVRPKGGAELTQEQVRAIKYTVTAAYAGLERNQVTVTDLATNRAYAGSSDDGIPSADDNLYAEYKARYERDWREKIKNHLSMIPGVVVGVNVDLDPKILHESQENKIDPKPVALETSESSETRNSTTPGTSGRPGTAPNSLVNTPAAVSQSAAAQSTTEITDAKSSAVASQQHTHTREVGLIPKQVQVSIDVPFSYYRRVWLERNPPAAGQEPPQPPAAELAKVEAETKKRIEDNLAKLLPRQPVGNDPYIPLVVTSYHDFAPTPATAPSMSDTLIGWLGSNWQTLAMVLVGLGSLWMLRGMVRIGTSTPAANAVAVAAEGTTSEVKPAAESTEEAPVVKLIRRKFGSTGPTLRDELKEMVKEDPDAAATVLRAWIGEAA